ncbi:MAG: hypothetical protein DRQ13_01960, partial [Ignavibacteriae bacterium]
MGKNAMKKNITLFLLFLFLNSAWSQTVWMQTDWSNNQFSSLENVDANASPGELILLNDPSNMVFAFSPTNLEGVWDMEVYNGKLFIAACTTPVSVDGGEIISFDYATNSFQWEYDVWEQGVIQMRSYDGKLYIPGVDSQGGWEWGNIYIYDGSSWVRKETVPHGIHVFDLIFYQGDMYVTTGTDINNYSAKVYKSTDEGNSWNEVFSVSPPGTGFRRFYMMGVYKDTLYIQSDLNAPEGKVLFRYDGSNWTDIPFDSLEPSVGVLEEFNNNFYFLNGRFFHIYNGNNWITVNLPFSGMVNASSTWKRIAKGLGFYKGIIFGGGEFGLLYSSEDGIEWQLESELGNPLEEIESIEVYHGRLYVGTNDTTGTGKVYVSASVSNGNLVSLKHNFGNPIEAGILNWNSLIPNENTSIKFQIRTADSDTALANTLFVGPDGTTQSFYEAPGQSLSSIHFGKNWMQYKVYLNTNDSTLTPVLQEVSISVLLTGINDRNILSENQISDFYIDQNYPNPFNPTTIIKYQIPE